MTANVVSLNRWHDALSSMLVAGSPDPHSSRRLVRSSTLSFPTAAYLSLLQMIASSRKSYLEPNSSPWKPLPRHTSTICLLRLYPTYAGTLYISGLPFLTSFTAADVTREDIWILQDHVSKNISEASEREQVESDTDEFAGHGELVLWTEDRKNIRFEGYTGEEGQSEYKYLEFEDVIRWRMGGGLVHL